MVEPPGSEYFDRRSPCSRWHLSLTETPASRLMNAVGGMLPDVLWRKEAVLKPMGKIAGILLRAGRVSLMGKVPNQQRFVVNPTLIWAVQSSTARMGDQDLGSVGPLPAQARLGDFWIPQRAIFAIGRAFFEPLDQVRHAVATDASSG